MDYSENIVDWRQGPENPRKRQHMMPPDYGQPRRPRLDYPSEHAPSLRPPPIPPIDSIKDLPAAFLEFSRQLFNSTLADRETPSRGPVIPDREVSSIRQLAGYDDLGHTVSKYDDPRYDRGFSRREEQLYSNRSFKEQDYNPGYEFSDYRDLGKQSQFGLGGRSEYDANTTSYRGRSTSYDELSNRGGRGTSRGGREFGNNRGGQGYQRGGASSTSTSGSYGRGMAGRGRGNTVRGGRGMARGVYKGEQMKPFTSKLSVSERIQSFIDYLTQQPEEQNPIQTLHINLSASGIPLKVDYQVEQVVISSVVKKFHGTLKLGGQFLVGLLGQSKKELKQEIYQKAVEILKTYSLKAILSLRDPGVEALCAKFGDVPMDSNGELKVSVVNLYHPASAESLNTLLKYMEENSLEAENYIALVEQYVSMSRCKLKVSFASQNAVNKMGNPVFKGIVSLGGVAMAIGHGITIKDCKRDAYKHLSIALKTKTVDQLLSGRNLQGFLPEHVWLNAQYSSVFNEKGSVNNRIVAGESKPKLPKYGIRSLPQKISAIATELKNSSITNNVVNSIDCTAREYGINPVVYYTSILIEDEKKGLRCEVCFDNVIIGVGQAATKKDTQTNAYTVAYELLLTSHINTIMAQPRKDPTTAVGPDFVEKVVKGGGRLGESNMNRIIKLQLDPYKRWKSAKELVILEYADWIVDREKNGFNILNLSTSMNAMLLEWTFPKRRDAINECKVSIQNEMSASAIAGNKTGARLRACCELLNTLYKTQTLLTLAVKYQPKTSYSWEELVSGAETWEIPADFNVTVGPPPVKEPEDKEEEEDLRPAAEFDEKAVKYATFLVQNFFSRDTLDEMTLGPGIPGKEKRAIKTQIKQLNLRMNALFEPRDHRIYISKPIDAAELVACLSRNGGQSGRYSFNTEPVKPHIELEPPICEMLSSQQNMRRFSTGPQSHGRGSASSGRGRGGNDQRGRGKSGTRGGSGQGGNFQSAGGRGRGGNDQRGRGRGGADQRGRGRGGADQMGRGRGISSQRGRGRGGNESGGRGSGGNNRGRGGRGGFQDRGRFRGMASGRGDNRTAQTSFSVDDFSSTPSSRPVYSTYEGSRASNFPRSGYSLNQPVYTDFEGSAQNTGYSDWDQNFF